MINDGNYSEMKSEMLNMCKNTFLPSEPDEMHAGEKPEDSNRTGKSLRYAEYPSHQKKNQTLQQPFECNGQGRDFIKEAIFFTHRRVRMAAGTSAAAAPGAWQQPPGTPGPSRSPPQTDA
eukprot:bmy_20719T0